MVEGTGLENRQAGNRLGGSNPSPSAIGKIYKLKLRKNDFYYLKILKVAEALATSLLSISQIFASEKPTLLPTLTTLPSPMNFPFLAGHKNIVFNSSVT